MIFSGKVVKVGNNIDTDVILPGKYLVLTDPSELAKHAMENIDPEFPEKVKDGAILVTGKNFGCGSSREQAVLALKHAGVRCIISESIARIFFRNAINVGLPILELENALEKIDEGDELTVDIKQGSILNRTKGKAYCTNPLPDLILDILSEGGLISYLKKRRKFV